MDDKKRSNKVLPAVFFLCGSLLVLALGVVSKRNDRERIALETRVTAEQVELRLESCIKSRANLVRSVAGVAWNNPQQVMDGWTERVSILTPLYSGVQAINYIDADWHIRVVYPAATNQRAINANLRANANPSVVEAMGRAQKAHQLVRTDIVELLQSGKGFALYQQIRSAEGRLLGFANGVFRISDLMRSCLSEERLRDRFAFRMYDGGALFYRQPATVERLNSQYLITAQIDVVGRPWRLDFAPSEEYLAATNDILDEVWMALGLLLVLSLAILMRSLLNKQNTLKENEDNYRMLVENQTDMVVKVNPQGEFLYVSPSYCRTFGKTEAELLGVQFMPMVHEADRETTNRSLNSLKQPPHSSYHEQRAMTKDGWRWLAWSNAAVLNANNEIEAITAVGRDVTDVKNLEGRIAHSQKMKALGEMAGGITHDFNNLLQVILGNIEFLIAKTEDDETKEQLQQLCEVVESATILTKKLSTLSRQEIPRQEVVDLNTFSNDLLALLRRTLPTSIKLSLVPADHQLQVRADKSLLEQVFLNICFNARDAVGEKGAIGIVIEKMTLDAASLRHMPDLEPGEYACISVTDNGCGIDSEVIPQIFDPFFTTKRTGTGTGLGLANCYSIVKQHKGMILVDSTPGAGSCFSVYLPLSESSGSPIRKAAELEAPQAPGSKNLILVVDDDAEIVSLTCATLKSAGYETIACTGGAQALELFEKHRDEICLVLLDLVMPGLTGREVAQRIRRVKKDAKILFISGYIPENKSEDLDGPILRKPYKRTQLMRVVAQLMTS